MDLNTFTKPLDELRTRAAQLDSDLRQIHKGIADYESSTEEDRVDRWKECVDISKKRRVQFQQAAQQVDNARKHLRKVESATGTLLNPLNWFDDEQKQLRKSRDALVLQVRDLERRRDHLELKFSFALAESRDAKDCLGRHRSFDIKAA